MMEALSVSNGGSHTERTVEWIQDEILKSASSCSSNDETTSSKGNANDLACCLVWNRIVETNPDLARFVVRAVGHILNQVYENKTEAMIARANVADALVVNLTVLLERLVCIGLQQQQGQQQQASPLREEVAGTTCSGHVMHVCSYRSYRSVVCVCVFFCVSFLSKGYGVHY